MNDNPPRLIGLDWGTTSCRAYLLGEGGAVLDRRLDGRGVLPLSRSSEGRSAAFEGELAALCGDWLRAAPGLPLVACGMVGSNQGWAEASYRHLPVDLSERPDSLTEVATAMGTLFIIPGLFKDGRTGSPGDHPDVIRGEETQLLGALPSEADRGDSPAVVVLPGTHTKWLRLDATLVSDFVTTMTGELFGLVMEHSIIARLAEEPSAPDLAAFDRGLDVVFTADHDSAPAAPADIATSLFSARTLVMAGELEPSAVKDYVSGLMIGAEVEQFARRWIGEQDTVGTPITICASAQLGSRYARALERAGIASALAPEDAVVTGLWRTAVALGLIDKEAS
ncbi:2-dehydro-3-deoxygalactonokinase [Sinomonas susongensis]|uniref:2-dehydro-3-deoxygalactonokinase n=1 Tax=Sinomonas susongensis TaxID=1324851 RepID=UPI001BB2BF64|nr:2-dehydro-3-deoxygalactonokinase [Sinomonas susongensis]